MLIASHLEDILKNIIKRKKHILVNIVIFLPTDFLSLSVSNIHCPCCSYVALNNLQFVKQLSCHLR